MMSEFKIGDRVRIMLAYDCKPIAVITALHDERMEGSRVTFPCAEVIGATIRKAISVPLRYLEKC